MTKTKRTGLGILTVALAGLSACSDKTAPADAGLKRDLAAAVGTAGDLELAPKSAQSQMVVSAIEGGPSATPAPAPRKAVPKPTPRPVPQVAEKREVAPTPMPEARVVESVPTPAPAPTHEPAPLPSKAAEPPPLPPATSGPVGRQQGVYKTEAEIFRQLPNIKP